jgi:N-acetyl-anhydromuramyl-L-alanine amidase AmpD
MYAPASDSPYLLKSCKELLDRERVSAHYFIDRDGAIAESLPAYLAAWHAGISKLPFKDDSRQKINEFSIGIELIGDKSSGFTDNQYLSLAKLVNHLTDKWPIKYILGHKIIAPERKDDPWLFCEERFRKAKINNLDKLILIINKI